MGGGWVGARIGDGVCTLVKDCGLKKRAWLYSGSILFSIDDTEVIPTCVICCDNSWDEEMPALTQRRLCLHCLIMSAFRL